MQDGRAEKRDTMGRARGLLGILSLAPMVVFAASQATEVPLLGEEYVKDVNDYAGRIGQEAKDIFRTPLEEWNFYGSYDRGLKVYWRPVKDNKVCCFVLLKPLHSMVALKVQVLPACTQGTCM